MDFSDIEVELPEDLDLEYYGIAVKNGEELWIADRALFNFDEQFSELLIRLFVLYEEPDPNINEWLLDEKLLFKVPENQVGEDITFNLVNRNKRPMEFPSILYIYWDLDALSNRYLIPEGCDKS